MIDNITCNIPNSDGFVWHTFDDKPCKGQDVLVWFEYFRYGAYNRKFQTYGIVKYPYVTLINGSTGWEQLRVLAWAELPKPFIETKKSKKLALTIKNNYGEDDK